MELLCETRMQELLRTHVVILGGAVCDDLLFEMSISSGEPCEWLVWGKLYYKFLFSCGVTYIKNSTPVKVRMRTDLLLNKHFI